MCHRKESGFWGSESNLKLGRFNMLFPYLSSWTGCLSGPEAVNGAGRLLWWCTRLVRPWQHCPTHFSLTITPPPRPFLVSYYAPILLSGRGSATWRRQTFFTCFHWCFQQWWTILNPSKEICNGSVTSALYKNATRTTREIRKERCVRTLENGC